MEPSRRANNSRRRRPKGKIAPRNCRMPPRMHKNEKSRNIRMLPGDIRPIWLWMARNNRCKSGINPDVQSTVPRRMRHRKECSHFMSRSSYRVFHSVAQAPHCFDGGSAHVAPQACDKYLNCVRIPVKALGIDVLDKLALGDQALLMVHKIRKHAEFMAGQLHLQAFQGYFAGSGIKHERTTAKFRPDMSARPSNECAQPSQ